MFDFEDCMRKGLLRNIPPSKEKAESSLKAAERWLEEATQGFGIKTFNSSVLSSYLTMFHAARAILFMDGFREKSHYCIARYLEEKYAKKKLLDKKWIELLDYYRELRHNSQYDTNFFASGKEAENALKIAKEFLEAIKPLIQKAVK